MRGSRRGGRGRAVRRRKHRMEAMMSSREGERGGRWQSTPLLVSVMRVMA